MNQSMSIDVLTIFPEYFDSIFEFGIIRRAKLAGIVEINVHDIRDRASCAHLDQLNMRRKGWSNCLNRFRHDLLHFERLVPQRRS